MRIQNSGLISLDLDCFFTKSRDIPWFYTNGQWCTSFTANEGPARININEINRNCAASLFPKQNYNVLSPNSYTHISVRYLYFQGRSVYFAAAKHVEPSCMGIYINRSQTHECGNWVWGRTIPRKGKHKCDFRCSVQCTLNHQTTCSELILLFKKACGF